MRAILISTRPQWVEKILNGIKKDEIRKGTVLYKAISKLIEEQGVAPMLLYCTKGQGLVFDSDGKGLVNSKLFPYAKNCPEHDRLINGKVLARFNATAEEIFAKPDRYKEFYFYDTIKLDMEDLLKQSCMEYNELNEYLDANNGTAIHINDLIIFDKPKELSEFEHQVTYINVYTDEKRYLREPLRKAPQSWCYVEL